MAEVMVVPDRETLALVADPYAPKYLHVHAADLDWFLERLQCYLRTISGCGVGGNVW